MLTVRYETLGVRPGDLLLDLGCGFGRHAFEAARRGATVVALDYAESELKEVRNTFAAMAEAGEVAPSSLAGTVQGDATRLPFADATFDRVIASEVLEHIADDVAAMGELARVLQAGRHHGRHRAGVAARAGLLGAVGRVPRALRRRRPRAHLPGGRAAREAARRGRRAGRGPPGPRAALALLVAALRGRPHQRDQPAGAGVPRASWSGTSSRRPPVTRVADRVLNPVLGKSLVVYARKGARS